MVLSASRDLHTNGVADPFVLERLSNAPAYPHVPCQFEPCVATVSERWQDAHYDCVRGLARLLLRRGTLLMVPHDLRTSGVADPFVLERLSNTPARLQEPPPRTADLSRAWPQ